MRDEWETVALCCGSPAGSEFASAADVRRLQGIADERTSGTHYNSATSETCEIPELDVL